MDDRAGVAPPVRRRSMTSSAEPALAGREAAGAFAQSAGLVAASADIPFGQVLLLAGRPGTQSTMVALLVLVDVLVNRALVPVLGATGAAIANAATQVCFVLWLKRLSSRALGLSI